MNTRIKIIFITNDYNTISRYYSLLINCYAFQSFSLNIFLLSAPGDVPDESDS